MNECLQCLLKHWDDTIAPAHRHTGNRRRYSDDDCPETRIFITSYLLMMRSVKIIAIAKLTPEIMAQYARGELTCHCIDLRKIACNAGSEFHHEDSRR